MTSSAWTAWRAPLTLAFALACGAPAAQAQFFFRPFAHGFHYVEPEDDYEPAPFGSRRAVARILSREGFRLVGPLGHRGEQVVATGVNRREGEMRFFIDPYEGYIIRGMRVGPPPELDRAPPGHGEYVEPLGGSRPVVRELGEDGRSRDRRRNAPDIARQTPPREVVRPEPRQITPPKPQAEPPAPAQNVTAPTVTPPAAVATPAPKAPVAAPPAPAPAPAPKTAAAPPPPPPPSVAKPAPQPAAPKVVKVEPPPVKVEPPPVKVEPTPAKIAAKPPEPAKPPPAAQSVVMKPAETPPSVVFKKPPEAVTPLPAAKSNPPGSAATKPEKAAAATSRAVAARSTGASSYRAIVPPRTAAGSTVVTPTAPGPTTAKAKESAKTPQNVAMPK